LQAKKEIWQGFSKVAFPRACGARRFKLLSFFAGFQPAKKLNNLNLKDALADWREQKGNFCKALKQRNKSAARSFIKYIEFLF